MAVGISIGDGGIAYPNTDCAPDVTITETFGNKSADISTLGTDYYNGIYLMKAAPSSNIADHAVSFTALKDGTIKILTVGVGGSNTGDVTIAIYSAASASGPWTKVDEIKQSVTTTGANEHVDFVKDIPISSGSIYFIAVGSPDVKLIEHSTSGGSGKWTYATPFPDTLDDADSSTSGFAIEVFATVETVQ